MISQTGVLEMLQLKSDSFFEEYYVFFAFFPKV